MRIQSINKINHVSPQGSKDNKGNKGNKGIKGNKGNKGEFLLDIMVLTLLWLYVTVYTTIDLDSPILGPDSKQPNIS